jgi:hypothetical protein
MRPHLLLPLLVALAAAEEPDPRRMKPDHAPTPYSADEIRKACTEGRADKFRLESGGKVRVQTTTFVKCDEKGAEMEFVATDESGKEEGRRSGTAAWTDLQAHASFPEKATKITEETIEVPAGKFDCLLYTVTEKDGVRRMWFAKKLPGPPVKMTKEAEGKVVFSMTLLEHSEKTKE